MNLNMLKAERVLQGKSMHDMANAINKKYVNYTKKENGDVKFQLEEVKAIAKFLNLDMCKVNEIFFDNELLNRNNSDINAK